MTFRPPSKNSLFSCLYRGWARVICCVFPPVRLGEGTQNNTEKCPPAPTACSNLMSPDYKGQSQRTAHYHTTTHLLPCSYCNEVFSVCPGAKLPQETFVGLDRSAEGFWVKGTQEERRL